MDLNGQMEIDFSLQEPEIEMEIIPVLGSSEMKILKLAEDEDGGI